MSDGKSGGAMTESCSIRSDGRPCSSRALVFLLGAISLLQACGGCAALRQRFAHDPGPFGQKGSSIGPAELDELTRAFADRYVGLLSSTCDALKGTTPTPSSGSRRRS
jgi:hypothetical protein